jgi:enoyl-CoA hydratase/carnithine racemase
METVVLGRGYAAGGGAGLVASARTVIVSTDFRFKLPGGNLARFASVALPLFNLRATSKPPHDDGWLGHEFDAAEARRLGLVDTVVPTQRLHILIESARKGIIAPELLRRIRPNETSVTKALTALAEFLKQLEDLSTRSSAPVQLNASTKCGTLPRTRE